MKKLALIIAVAGIVGLTSCAKSTDVKCTYVIGGVTTTVTVGEEDYKTCVGALCSTVDLAGTQDEYVTSLEAAGYTCE